MTDNQMRRQVISYLQLRSAVGALGMLFPVLLAVLGATRGKIDGLMPTISHYYGTSERDLFVGILFAIAMFLFSYKGYEKEDNIAGSVASVLAVGVAIFPTTSASETIRTMHFVFATGLFLVFTYFSLVLFRKSGGNMTPRKKARNSVYFTCGMIMLACIALIAAYHLFDWNQTGLAKIKPVFWLESIALWAFGISWLTKGEIVLPDKR